MLPAAVLARPGMPAIAALVFLAVLAVAMACWVISNGDRSGRAFFRVSVQVAGHEHEGRVSLLPG
jgi:hypothetical protein